MNQYPQPLPEIKRIIYIPELCVKLTEAFTQHDFASFFNIINTHQHNDLINLAAELMTSSQQFDTPTLCSLLTEAYVHLNFEWFFNFLKIHPQNDLMNHATEMMTSSYMYTENREYPNIFYMLTINNSFKYFDDAVRILGNDDSKECIKQSMFSYRNVFQAYWLKKQYGACSVILNLLTIEEREKILQEIMRDELNVYFTLFLNFKFPQQLHNLLIPHIVNLDIENRVDISAMSGLPLLEILLRMPCPGLIPDKKILLFQFLWLESQYPEDAKSLTRYALKNEEIQNSLLTFLLDKNNIETNCLIKAIQHFDGTAAYIELIEKLLYALGSRFQLSLQHNREKYDILFDLLLQHNSTNLTRLILKQINDVDLLVGIYQDLLSIQSNSDAFKKHFLWLTIQQIIEIFDSHQPDPLQKISNAEEYQEISNKIAQPQQSSNARELLQSYVQCVISISCATKNFPLAKTLLSLLSAEEQQHFLIQQPTKNNTFPGLLCHILDSNTADPIKPILSLTEPNVMVNALLSIIPSLELRFIQLAWLKSNSDNAFELSLFLSRHQDTDQILPLLLNEFQYDQKQYGNFINCLIEHGNERNAINLLYMIKNQAHQIFTCKWFEYRNKENKPDLLHSDAFCYLLQVRKVYLIEKLLQLKYLKEEHIKKANLQLHRQDKFYYYLLLTINRGSILLFKLGISAIDATNAKQIFQKVIQKELKDGDLQHNLLTYAFFEFNNLTPAQLIEIVKIARNSVREKITSLFLLPYNVKENIFSKLIKINNKPLNTLIIELFDNVAELTSLSENFVQTAPDCDAKNELLNLIQNQIKKITPTLPILSAGIARSSSTLHRTRDISGKNGIPCLASTGVEISHLEQQLNQFVTYFLRCHNSPQSSSQRLNDNESKALNKYKILLNHYAHDDVAICYIAIVILYSPDTPSSFLTALINKINIDKEKLSADLKRYLSQNKNGDTAMIDQLLFSLLMYTTSDQQEMPRLDTQPSSNTALALKPP